MLDFSVQDDIRLCKKLLENNGYSHLTDLLNREKEIELFKAIKEYALKKSKNGRTAKPELIKKYKIQVSVIPSSRLKVVCAVDQKKIKITPLGKYLIALYQKLEENNVDGYLFLVGGSAKETLGLRPSKKSAIQSWENLAHISNTNSPKTDGDIVLYTNNSLVDEKMIAGLLSEEETTNTLKLKIISSKSRPFTRVDIGQVYNPNIIQDYQWKKYWESFGHITLPEFKAKYSSSVSFIQNLMGREDSTTQILLVPIDTSAEFIGAYLDFFPKHHFYKKVPYVTNNKLRHLKPTVINWPEIMFPVEESHQEALTHFIFLLKGSVKSNEIPLICSGEKDKLFTTLTKLSQLRMKKIHTFSFETSLYFANKIVYKIASNPNSIANNPHAMLQWTEKLIDIIKGTLNGNSYLGLIYLLAAGENPTDAPVYGTGIIDPKGFFLELYEFLHQGDRLERLIRLMEETEEGPTMKGWPTFLNFIYSETSFDLKKTAKLLNPNFCSMEIYPTLVEEFILPDLQKPTLPFESLSEAPSVST
jgi:hypothetical protein